MPSSINNFFKAPIPSVAVAVRGSGSISLQHAAALKKIGCRPVVVPVRPERLDTVRSMGYKTASTLKEARLTGALGAIIGTDTKRHPDDALEALDLGFDLLIEKPFGVSHKALDSLLQQWRNSDCLGFISYPLRFDSGLLRFRELSSKIGPIHRVRIVCHSYLPDWRPNRDYHNSYSARKDEGGVLRDLIHEVDYAGWCFGWPQKLFAVLMNSGRLGIEAEESADLWWSLNGCILSIHLDYLTRPSERSLTAMGSQGTLKWDIMGQKVEFWTGNNQTLKENYSCTKDDRLMKEDAAFVQAIAKRCDATGLLPNFEEGARSVAVCDAARISSISGKAVLVDAQASKPKRLERASLRSS